MRDRIEGLRRRIPIWVDGVLVGLLAWQLTFATPSTGLDPSWVAGLYMAAHHGLDFGTEIVFTYGPLGYLDRPSLWYGGLAVQAFLYSAALYLTFTCTLVWALNRSFGRIGSAALAFVFLATAPNLEQISLVIAVAWALAALDRDRPRYATAVLVYGGAAFSAVQCLVKLSLGPPILVVCLIAMVGVGAGRRQWLHFLGLFAGLLLVLWLLTGQSLLALPDYALNGQQIVSGYNEAMRMDVSERWEAIAALLVSLALIGGAFAAGPYRSLRARVCAAALVSLAAFAIFKYAVVRFEPNHVAIALSTALAIWLVIPWSPRRLALMFTGMVAIAIVAISTYPNPSRFDPVPHLTTFKDQVRMLLRPGERERIAAEAKLAMREEYGIRPGMLAELRGKRVAVEPWETAAVWAYDLDWAPLPVFQNYSAFTSELDRLNSEEIEDPDGPQLILRGRERAFEGRNPLWDPPEQNRAVLCDFSLLDSSRGWQLLERSGERCGKPELIRRVDAAPGEAVEVPLAEPGELVFARLGGVGPQGLQKLRTLLFRSGYVLAYLNDDSFSYRVLPETASDGLVLSVGPGTDASGSFAEVPYPPQPMIEEIRLEGVESEFSLELYRVPVRSGASGA